MELRGLFAILMVLTVGILAADAKKPRDPMEAFIKYYGRRKALVTMINEAQPAKMPLAPEGGAKRMLADIVRSGEIEETSTDIELEEDPPLGPTADSEAFDSEEVAQMEEEEMPHISNIEGNATKNGKSERVSGKSFFHMPQSPSDKLVLDISYATYPRRTAVKILFGGSGYSGFVGACSGAMIDDKTILTAAHCVYDRDASPMTWYSNFFIIPNYNDDQAPTGFFHTEHPYGVARATNLLEFGYAVAGDFAFDVGAIRLDRRMNTGYMGWTTLLPGNGQQVRFVGYPGVNYDQRSLIYSDGNINNVIGTNLREANSLNCNGFSGSNVYQATCGDEAACARVWGVVSYIRCSSPPCCAFVTGIATVSSSRRTTLNNYMAGWPVPPNRPYILWYVRQSEIGKSVTSYFYEGSTLNFQLSLVNRGWANSGALTVSFYAVDSVNSLSNVPANTAAYVFLSSFTTSTTLNSNTFVNLSGTINMPTSLTTGKSYYIMAFPRAAVTEYSKDFSAHVVYMGTSFNRGPKVALGGICSRTEDCLSGSCVSSICYNSSTDSCTSYMLPTIRSSAYTKLAAYMSARSATWVAEAKRQGCNVIAYDTDSLPEVCAAAGISTTDCNAISGSSRFVANWPGDQSRSWSTGTLGPGSPAAVPVVSSRNLSPYKDCVPGTSSNARENFLNLSSPSWTKIADIRNRGVDSVYQHAAAAGISTSCAIYATVAQNSFPSTQQRFYQTLTAPRTMPQSPTAMTYFSRPVGSSNWRFVSAGRVRSSSWNDAGALLMDEQLLWEDDGGGLCASASGTWRFGIGLKNSRTLNVCPLSKLYPCTYLPPITCQMSAWSEWSTCTSTGGDPWVGTQQRTRTIVRQPRCRSCPSAVETRTCFLFSTPNGAGQYLKNRGFEANAFWLRTRASYNTAIKLKGSRSIYFANGFFSRAMQPLALPANTNFKFNCAFRRGTGNMKLVVRYRQGSRIIGQIQGVGIAENANWRRNGLQIKTPADGIYEFRVEGPTAAKLWIDDCSLIVPNYTFSPPNSSGELMRNGGFEAVGARWTLSSPKVAYSKIKVYRGQWALRFTNAATASQLLVLPGEKQYQMRCYMRGTQAIALKVVKDPSGFPKTVAPYFSSNVFVNEGVSFWRKVTIRFRTPEDNAYNLMIEAPDGAFGYADTCNCKEI